MLIFSGRTDATNYWHNRFVSVQFPKGNTSYRLHLKAPGTNIPIHVFTVTVGSISDQTTGLLSVSLPTVRIYQ